MSLFSRVRFVLCYDDLVTTDLRLRQFLYSNSLYLSTRELVLLCVQTSCVVEGRDYEYMVNSETGNRER